MNGVYGAVQKFNSLRRLNRKYSSISGRAECFSLLSASKISELYDRDVFC